MELCDFKEDLYPMKLSNLSNESLIDAYYRANLLGLDDSFIELLFEAILARNLNHLLN
jgi:hypothetical protein